MATLAQLEAEPWWGRELVTSPMVGLGLQLRVAYGTGADSVGVKGNTAHLSGGHRSQEWIKNSAYCTNRSYATQSGLSGDQLRYCSALDFTPGAWGTADNRAKMRVLTARVIDAMKGGRCDELLEVFGTLDGQTVTGWRNDTNSAATSDSSHLDHLHLRFDRRFANDNATMSKMAAILLEDDMLTQQDLADISDFMWTKWNAGSSAHPTNLLALLRQASSVQIPADLTARLDAILAAAQDDGNTSVVLDPAALAELQDIKAAIAGVPAATASDLAARLES